MIAVDSVMTGTYAAYACTHSSIIIFILIAIFIIRFDWFSKVSLFPNPILSPFVY